MSIASNIYRNLSNLPGWRTNRKIVVFESDDWGSVRMPSREAFEVLTKQGLNLIAGDSKRYNLYDSLESPEDLEALFEVLSSVKDKNGNNCIFTPLAIVANPDFEKIRDNGFNEYYYEPFTVTLNRYYGSDKTFNLWHEGIRHKLFIPQFHGREHLNVAEWMRDLQQPSNEAILAFDQSLWGFKRKLKGNNQISYQAAFDLYNPEDLYVHNKAIEEGLELFNTIFGYKASYFVAPNGPLHISLEQIAAQNGIRYLFAPKIQTHPVGWGKTKKAYHYLGQQNKWEQYYTVRNCFFEPSLPGKDWVASCLKDIEIAFRWNKPADISTHRVNYIGVLNRTNRDNGLSQLRVLLANILQKWPEVEFIGSDSLGKIIEQTK